MSALAACALCYVSLCITIYSILGIVFLVKDETTVHNCGDASSAACLAVYNWCISVFVVFPVINISLSCSGISETALRDPSGMKIVQFISGVCSLSYVISGGILLFNNNICVSFKTTNIYNWGLTTFIFHILSVFIFVGSCLVPVLCTMADSMVGSVQAYNVVEEKTHAHTVAVSPMHGDVKKADDEKAGENDKNDNHVDSITNPLHAIVLVEDPDDQEL